MRIKLSAFIALLVVTVALIPASVVAYMFYQQMHIAVEQTTKQNLALQSSLTGEKLTYRMEVLLSGLALFAREKGEAEFELTSKREINNRLRQFLNTYRIVNSFYLLDAKGQVVTGIGAAKKHIISENFAAKPEFNVKAEPHGSFIFFSNSQLVHSVENPYGIAIVTPVFNKRHELTSYLLSIIPSQDLPQLIGNYSKQFKVAFYHQGSWLAGDYWEANDEINDYVHAIDIGLPNYGNLLSLNIHIAEPADRLMFAVAQAMTPIYGVGATLCLATLIFSFFIARYITRSLSRFYQHINNLQAGIKDDYQPRFWVVELHNLYQIFNKMQLTIGEQVSNLQSKNSELKQADILRQQYLSQVESLNKELEEKVQERTQTLEETLKLVEESSVVLERVIRYRRDLQGLDNAAVIDLTLDNLQQSLPKTDMALLIQGDRHHQAAMKQTRPVFELDQVLSKTMALGEEQWHQGVGVLDDGTPVLRLGRNGSGLGCLALKQMPSSQFQHCLLMFVKELGSYLEIRKLTAELDFLARTDALTQLGNRKLFDETLEGFETQLDTEVGLFIIDVNGLKQVNDNKGHEVGDALLQKVAELIRHCSAGITDKCFRLGGDEYAIILSGDELKQSQTLYKRLLEEQPKMNFAFDVMGGYSDFSCSIGFASTANTIFSMLYSVADQNMYQVKREHYRDARAKKMA